MKKLVISLVVIAFLTVPFYGDDSEGFFVELDSWYAQPDNSYAVGYDNPNRWENPDEENNWTGGDALRFDFDESYTLGLEFGYDTDQYGAFSVSYWGYDEDEEELWTSPGTEDIVSPYSHPWSDNRFGADYLGWSGETDAQIIDLKWSNDFCGDCVFSAEYYTGLRFWDYEQKSDLVVSKTYGTYDPNDSNSETGIIKVKSDNDGWGFMGGLDGAYDFSDRFSLHSGLELAFLKGDSDFTYNYKALKNMDGYVWWTQSTNNREDEIFVQYSLDTGVKYSFPFGLYLDGGYKYASWVDALQKGSATAWNDTYSPDFRTQDVNWSGFYFDVGYKF